MQSDISNQESVQESVQKTCDPFLLAHLKERFNGADVITTREFADYLRISGVTLWQMRKAGTAPRIKQLAGNGQGRIFLYDLARWIEDGGAERKTGADGRGRQAKKSSVTEGKTSQLAMAQAF